MMSSSGSGEIDDDCHYIDDDDCNYRDDDDDDDDDCNYIDDDDSLDTDDVSKESCSDIVLSAWI